MRVQLDRPLTREDFTVGWICALDIELAAALAVLDEKIPQPPFGKTEGDTNKYHFGRIKNRYIVVACLPAGCHGAATASVVAAYMMISFPAIRKHGFGLLVGVGGGVPTPGGHKGHDIRLGDVVVGMKVDNSPCIVPYDMGTAMEGGGFLPEAVLSTSPTILLSVLSTIDSKNQTTFGKGLRDRARQIGENDTRFQYPQSPDHLFQANYFHNAPHSSARTKMNNCNQCDLTKRVPRPAKTSDHPSIHYGPIASGNLTMQDGVKRDMIAARTGALCFEMEAAGLMNHFPCLVVRGISNYADGHRNKSWQPYASLMAALYAREILSTVH
ncbi:hypothetical protein TWF718_006739 [Orbilia javanica]|uniref:Nucleoside phosphorylase domain-containing protein n=1 Tax=Orbilia javanica TaxID=47235 RepID=A0AAN8MXB7_9PEZI